MKAWLWRESRAGEPLWARLLVAVSVFLLAGALAWVYDSGTLECLGRDIQPSQESLAQSLDWRGDRDGVAEFHNGVPEDSPAWDCSTMGNLVCGDR